MMMLIKEKVGIMPNRRESHGLKKKKKKEKGEKMKNSI